MNEELKVIISAEVGKLKQAVATAKKDIQSFATKSKENLKKFGDEFSKVGDACKKGLAVVGGAVVAAAGALLGLSASTAEYRTAQAKLNTAFETAGSSAKTAKTTYNDLYRVLGDSDVAVEAAAHLAKMTTEEKALSEWTNICQGVYATFGDSLPIEGLTEAANETAKTGTVTGTLADALNWAGVSEDAFNESLAACNTEAEREQLIRETLNGLYSDAAANYEKNNAAVIAQNEAQSKLNEAMAAAGEAIAPINTALTELAATVLAQLTPYIEQFAAEYMPAITEALSGVGEKIGEVITWIADNWDLLVNLGTVILTVAAACSVFSTAMGIVNAVMAASPVTWMVAAVVALIAVIALCVVYWDEIKAAIVNFAQAVGEWFAGLWTSITDWVSNTAASISEWWGSISEGFSSWFSGLQQGWTSFWSGIGEKISSGVENAKQKFSDMKQAITDAVSNAKEAAVNKFNEIKSGIEEKVGAAKEAVTNKFNEIKTNITNKVNEAKTAVTNKFNEIKTAISNKVTEAKTAVTNKFTEIKTNISNKVSEAKQAVSNKFGEIATTVGTKAGEALTKAKEKFNSIKTSISDAISGAKQIVSDKIAEIKSALGLSGFSWKIPKPSFPKFSVSGGQAPWGFMGEGSLPRISISWNALGGVFENPTVRHFGNSLQGLAENGAEAIVPLENNLGWLDKMAGMLHERMGGNQPIVLTVDGKVFAQTTINSINQLTRQTGSLGLNLY